MKFAAPATIALIAVGSASAAVTPAPKNVCSILQKASLINLDLLGCSNVDISILGSSKITKKQACKSLQQGGLVNLDVLGCSNADLDILSDDGTTAVGKTTCSAGPTCSLLQKGLLDLNLLGCLNLSLDILKRDEEIVERGAAHHTSKTTTKTATPTKTTTTTKPTSTPTKKPCNNAAACSILQKGGLINLGLLGCANIKVDIL
ncbi:hypothetical protein OC835_000275 [Tilletia horrida]|uniref:Hydrophobin n=1 Tax=Tilletia horrida TaxID=155126 RepID=A0AAN6GCK5_9BASI|nr:hypothetical protein OC842_002814 [Tilletia horrida]KAK0541291.1 hypothetical protein OC835_000275 [Tilletia horrida]